VPPSPTRTATFTNTALPPATRTSTATATSTGKPITATATPPIPAGISIGDVAIVEGNEGTRSAVFAVRLRGRATYPVKVSAKTVDGTARVADSDYDALTTALIFNAFENQKTVSVTVRGDRFVETSETFSVVLGAAIGAPIADATGIGTIISDEQLSVGVPELVPPNPATAPQDLTSLILRWAHPQRWRALDTIDLRLRDDDQPVLWVRFDEAANTLAVCTADGRCGAGVEPGTGAPIAGETATFYPGESAVRGTGPTGPSVDLIVTFSLAQSLAGRVVQVETAAREDSGEQQGFLPIASLEVIDTGPSGADDDGCAVQPARHAGFRGTAILTLGLLALLGLATRRRRGPAQRGDQ
jgi:MYXO-CTERM domain-containing protein